MQEAGMAVKKMTQASITHTGGILHIWKHFNLIYKPLLIIPVQSKDQ